ncbi:molybdopterin-dependent oxidoreductase [Eggerthella sinensis]|uniref:molybdopterin-dependent oxidoreductase n=1 Tax=Eggerthella sinensis TaxID=242230 RepID=UPI00248D6DFF|nr:molybdopterin-dependent oxidoreductase [Eggerthella sinensis]
MMKTTTQYGRATLSALAGFTMVASMAATPVVALAGEPAADGAAAAGGTEAPAQGTAVESSQVMPADVEGTFAYDQTTLTSNDVIKTFFQRVSQAICGATVPLVADNPLGWQLSVTGDVESAFTASVGDLANEESVNKVMTCTCGGNPAGGRAIITADVKGIPVEHLLSRAGVSAEANAVTFVSSDGTQQTFPLGYVVGRHAVLSYEINDEDLSASVGGNNQLWMTKTPANYFVRDVVEIVVSTEAEAPEAPGVADEHPNSPNAGVLAGTQD